MQLRSLRHFLGLCLGLEFGQNQPKTVDKKAIFSTRERVLKSLPNEALVRALDVSRLHSLTACCGERENPQRVPTTLPPRECGKPSHKRDSASADLLPGFLAAACAQTKVSVESGLQLASAFAAMSLQNLSINIRKIPHFVTCLGGEVRPGHRGEQTRVLRFPR